MKINLEEIKKLIDKKYSTYKIAKFFNCSQSTVLRFMKKYDLSSKYYEKKNCLHCGKNISSKLIFCCNSCKTNHEAIKFGELWEKEGDSILPYSIRKTGLIRGKARRYVFIKNDFKCSKCGWTFNFEDGSFPPLECSHVDNNPNNNNFSNIELICPNCHAIKTRLESKIKGSGRWSIGLDSRKYRISSTVERFAYIENVNGSNPLSCT